MTETDLITIHRSDLPAVAALHTRCFARPWDVAALQGLWKSGCGGWGIWRDGELCAFLITRSAEDEAEILSIVTHPDLQRHGLAERLLRHGFVALAEQKIRTIYLEVRADNHAAAALYEKTGFARIAVRKDYYTMPDGTARDALIFSRSL